MKYSSPNYTTQLRSQAIAHNLSFHHGLPQLNSRYGQNNSPEIIMNNKNLINKLPVKPSTLSATMPSLQAKFYLSQNSDTPARTRGERMVLGTCVFFAAISQKLFAICCLAPLLIPVIRSRAQISWDKAPRVTWFVGAAGAAYWT